MSRSLGGSSTIYVITQLTRTFCMALRLFNASYASKDNHWLVHLIGKVIQSIFNWCFFKRNVSVRWSGRGGESLVWKKRRINLQVDKRNDPKLLLYYIGNNTVQLGLRPRVKCRKPHISNPHGIRDLWIRKFRKSKFWRPLAAKL